MPGHIFVLSAGIVDDPKRKVSACPPPSWKVEKALRRSAKKIRDFFTSEKKVGAFHVVLGQNSACASSFGFEAKQF